MVFKLTEEQINYIIEMYGGTCNLINKVEQKLNLLEIIETEEDYFELVIIIVSQVKSVNLQMSMYFSMDSKMKKYLSLDEIIALEINRKYNDMNTKEETNKKIKRLSKIRHN